MNHLVKNSTILKTNNIIKNVIIRGYASEAQMSHQEKREADRLERKKKAQEAALKEDNRSNTEKILEKFKIPKIIDLAEPVHTSHSKLMKMAKKRIEAENAKLPPLSNPQYAGQFKYTSGVIVERFPSLNPLPTEYEKQYQEAYQRLEELIRREPIRFVSMVEDLPEFKEESREKKEQENVADEFEEDFDNYKPESRITKDDVADNRKSLDRKLDKSLYLIINKAGSRYDWQFPSTNWIKGESIKNTAERSLRDSLGSNWKYWIPSQAPCGVYKYRVEDEVQDLIKAEGIKEFFFRAHYFGGELNFNEKIVKDYLWVTKEELQEYFDEDYYNNTVKLIFDDCYYGHIIEE